jgi:hypothetical protein
MAVRKAKQRARGIIPDHEIQPTIGDILNQQDTQLNYTLELVRNDK